MFTFIYSKDILEKDKKFMKNKKVVNRLNAKSGVKAISSTTRIHNPVTNSYYSLRVRNTSAGKKGTIIGKWSPKS